MRKLFSLLLILLVSCVSVQKMPEGQFVKTKVYVGKYISSYQIDDKFTLIETNMGMFKIKSNPDIPDSVLCYVRLEYPVKDYHPDIYKQLTGKYLSWVGSDKEYFIFNDIKKIQ